MSRALCRCLPIAGLAAILAMPALSDGRVYVLFQGTFDQSMSSIQAEVGSFYAWFSQSSALKIISDGSGGNALVFDDLGQATAASVIVAGGFENNAKLSKGTFEWSFEVTYGQIDTPFDAGIVVDSPGSDFIPATGPDNGEMILFGKPSGQGVIPNVPYEIAIELTKENENDDWSYSAVIKERGQKVAPPPIKGRVAGTKGASVLGFAFEKYGGSHGSVVIDDVLVTTEKPLASGF